MKNFGNKHYFSRAETRAMSSEHPIGDPYGGAAYGELSDPVTATVGAVGGGLLGGMMQGNAAKDAAETSANAQRDASRIGAEASRFVPVGTTTRFGQSNFGFDPSGRLNQAGYTLSPEMQQQQDMLMAMAGQGLEQYGMGEQYARPMLDASQSMMGLGQQYLGTSPEEQAAKYFQNQQALLNPDRLARLSNVRNELAQQGRAGLAVGGDGGMQATNPELAAYYNSIAQQDAQIASQADQAGMNYAKFGSGLVGLGGDMLSNYYNAQTSAMSPYSQALQGAQMIEGMGQGAMDLGTSLGAKSATAGANQGNILSQGLSNAALTQQKGNAWSPFGSMLSGAGNAMMPYAQSMWNQPDYNALDFIPNATAANSANMTGFRVDPYK